MLRPTDSPMPIGIGFLLLSFGAKFTSAVPYQIYQLDERQVNIDTTTTDSFISTTTSAVAPIDVLPTTSSDVVVINTETSTHNDATVVDTTTNNAPVVEPPTTIGQIVDEPITSAGIAPVGTETSSIGDVLSSTGPPVENPIPTTTDAQTTSNWIPPAGTETNVVGTPGPNTDVPPPAGTTTSDVIEPIGTTTNTELPPAGTETTTNVPGPVIDTTTSAQVPAGTETTSNAIEPVDTTTDVPAPVPETTTSQPLAPVDTTTSAAIPPPNTDTQTSSAAAPPPETTTDKVDAPSTTAPMNNIPSTTEKVSEPSDKPSDVPSAPVTAPPQETTAAAASQAQVTASEYNSKVDDIIPIIVAWTNNPDGLKTDTLNKVNNLIDGVKGAIKDLGGNESGGCPGKRRRGLLDIVSNVINTLSCVVSNLEDVSGKITGGVVEGVTPIVSTLTNNSNDLKEQSEEKDEDEQSKTDKEESKTEEEESKTEESKTEASTTEKPTSTEATTTTSAETTTETTGSCRMRETTSLPGASDTQPKTSIALPPTSGDGATGSETSAGPSETGTSDVPTSAEATTTAQVPESTTGAGTSAQETSTKPADDTSTADETTKGEETSKAETDTSAPATTTPSTLLTTTRPSDQTTNTIISGSTEIITSSEGITTAPTRTYYPCNIYGGPRVTSAYCQCSTTVSGKQYIATATLIDDRCEAYTEYPSKVDPATEAPPPTQAPINEPLTKTIDGTVLAWTAYTLAYGQVYKDVTVTFSNGVGDVKTIATPVPTQTHVDNDGSGQCGTSDGLSKSGLGDACDRAIGEFEDDTIYTGYTTRYSRSKKGILMVASMGQAACIAKFSCDDYGIGMSGRLIKEARENAKKNDNIWMCGHIELSNSCKVVMDYCTNCNNEG
ncbi:hypothetical protein FBEOM_725 [Fusarium beomiforme]|uniref:Uncharacterized protein n=1 Tax=Fusarium beomiforme TaxID=44412 RepID=A0A9P5AUN1_9HYPO|nr:hypothetical protein FBEOM_725 [Fusarium beomiforme]